MDHHEIHTEGIRDVSKIDMQFAEQLGYTISCSGSPNKFPVKTRRAGSVYPLIPNAHVLASVNQRFQRLLCARRCRRRHAFYGRGAGKTPPPAPLSDVPMRHSISRLGAKCAWPIQCLRQRKAAWCPRGNHLALLHPSERGGWIVGVLAKFQHLASARSASPRSSSRKFEGESVPLILMIHDAERRHAKALAKIAKLPVIKSKPVMFGWKVLRNVTLSSIARTVNRRPSICGRLLQVSADRGASIFQNSSRALRLTELAAFSRLPYHEIAFRVLSKFTDGIVPPAELAKFARWPSTFPCHGSRQLPHVPDALGPRPDRVVQGFCRADDGAVDLGKFLREDGKQVTILTATSGDTELAIGSRVSQNSRRSRHRPVSDDGGERNQRKLMTTLRTTSAAWRLMGNLMTVRRWSNVRSPIPI